MNPLFRIARNILTNNRIIILSLIRAGILGVALVWAAIAISVISRTGGRIASSIILQLGTGAGIIFLLLIVVIWTWALLRAVETNPEPRADEPTAKPEPIKLLPDFNPPSIYPDLLVCLKPGETLGIFAQRMEAAQTAVTTDVWAAIIPPFRKQVAIYTGREETDFFFDRGDEPFKDELLDGEHLPKNLECQGEELKQYWRYVKWFCAHFNRWKEGAKLEANKHRAKETLLNSVKNQAKVVTVGAALLVLCFTGAFGQSKTRQVDQALGTRVTEIPKAGTPITFAFQEGSKEVYYTRTGDGKSDYTTLLQTPVGIAEYNDDGGRLVYVQSGKEVVARGPEIEAVNPEQPLVNQYPRNTGNGYLQPSQSDDPVRPRTVGGEPASYINSSIDSSVIATNIDKAKDEIRKGRSALWKSAKPIWEFVMWCFGGIFIFLICILGLARYIAKSAANESLINTYGRVIVGGWIVSAQQNAAAFTLVIMWIICVILLINEFLWLVWLNLPVWGLLLTWFPSLWIAEKITDWAVPNIQVINTGGGRSSTREVVTY